MYPNPFNEIVTIDINDASESNRYVIKIYDAMGVEIMNTIITKTSTLLNLGDFKSGILFYKVFSNEENIQAGKLVAK